MTIETRACQNCKQNFTIAPEDFAFYEKMHVLPPTWCPECRMIRRLASVSYRSLYWNTCKRCNKKLLSTFSSDKPLTIYCNDCWWSDKWDPLSYGREYDFSRSFFAQFQELMLAVPQMALSVESPRMFNSDYCNAAGGLKDCYLVFHADDSENCYYSDYLAKVRDCVDVLSTSECELCYESSNLFKCHRVLYSMECENSNDLYACRDCKGCSDCIGSIGLRNKRYYIFNKPYAKEEYVAAKARMNLETRNGVQELMRKAKEVWHATPHKYMRSENAEDASGDYVFQAKNTRDCFFVSDVENCRYSALLFWNIKDAYDYSSWGNNASLIYDSHNIGQDVYQMRFCYMTWDKCADCTFAVSCLNSNNLFACIGLRKKQYCILNKQYTKEAYEQLVPKIIEQMNAMPYIDSRGRAYRYGEFFPPELSLVSYNESVAQTFFPKSRDEVAAFGSLWKEPEDKQYTPTMESGSVPGDIRAVAEDITKRIIACSRAAEGNEHCAKVFKIIPQELAFYKKLGIPLPIRCTQCRFYDRVHRRNPWKLWSRACQCTGVGSENGVYKNTSSHAHGVAHCSTIFETTFAPDRPEIVYCKECYQSEVV